MSSYRAYSVCASRGRFVLLGLLMLLGLMAVARAEAGPESGPQSWPGTSVFHSTVLAEDSAGSKAPWSRFAGRKQLVAFVYTHCLSMCPLIVADMKKIEAMLGLSAMSPAERARYAFILISLDPDKDSATVRQAFLQEQGLDHAPWQFLRTEPGDLPEWAALVNVRYRPEANEIAHSNALTVLDERGVLQFQRQGAGDLEAVVSALRQPSK